MGRGRWADTPVRVRLGLALIVALAPVLIIGAIQSTLAARRDTRVHQAELASAAERSAATARARLAAAEVLLQTITPESVGYQCASRLAEIKNRIPGYDNLIRFDAAGRVACAAAGAPADPARSARPWFLALAGGRPMTVTSQGGVAYADQPALLASVRAEDASGRFEGVLTAVIDLASLRPQTVDRSLPELSEVAITDRFGHLLSTTRADAFAVDIGARLAGRGRAGPGLWFEPDRDRRERVFSSAPLLDQEVYVVLSAPFQGVVSWAVFNPFSAIVLPALAFLAPLLAVSFVAERGVVRWIVYLRRIAAIYAKGRFSVRPTRAVAAPPEIRQLAESMDSMARTITERDADLRRTVAQKDDLLRETHHRVKNNLQVISSLLNMQERALTDPAARVAMFETRQRVSAMALIYRALYQGPDLKQVDLRDFLDQLIALTVAGERGAPIRTEIDVDHIDIDADRLAPLALFTVEAISNARKHCLDLAGGVLSVGYHVADEMAELTVADSGVPGADKAKAKDGVGRTLMSAFARQLRGEVRYTTNKAGGLTTRLTFPTSDAQSD